MSEKQKKITALKEGEKIIKNEVTERQNSEMKRNLEQLREPGASSWLSARPLKEHGFDLNK